MKGKYITTYVRLACLSHQKRTDMHAELAQAITERKQLLLQWRQLLLTWLLPDKGNIYAQLQATIEERNRILDGLDRTTQLTTIQILRIDDRKAA